jgi:two-component system response regulator YesN
MDDRPETSYSVLIADDEYLVRERLKRIVPFESLGLRLAGEAEDGQTALQMARTLAPDIAIVDINMPFLNGLDLIKAFKELEKEPVVLILSGYDEFSYARQAIRLSVSDYLVKPVEPAQLEEALASAVARLRTRADEAKAIQKKAEEIHDILAVRTFLVSGTIGEGCSPSLKRFLHPSDGEHLHLLVIRGPESTALAVEENLRERGYGTRRVPRITKGSILIVRTACEGLPDLSSFARADGTAISFAGPCSSPKEVIHAYVRCERTLLRRFFSPGPSYAAGERCIDCSFVDTLVIQWDQVLRHGSADSARALVGEHCSALAENGSGKCLLRYVQKTLQALERFRETWEGQDVALLAVDVDLLHMLDLFEEIGDLSSWLVELGTSGIPLAGGEPGQEPQSVSERVRQLIGTLYADPSLDLPMIARFLGFHPNYVSARFKQETGTGISQYLKEVRLSRAKELLRSMECQEAAWAVGFADPYYFSKCFKKQFGYSPSEHRETRP